MRDLHRKGRRRPERRNPATSVRRLEIYGRLQRSPSVSGMTREGAPAALPSRVGGGGVINWRRARGLGERPCGRSSSGTRRAAPASRRWPRIWSSGCSASAIGSPASISIRGSGRRHAFSPTAKPGRRRRNSPSRGPATKRFGPPQANRCRSASRRWRATMTPRCSTVRAPTRRCRALRIAAPTCW